MPTPRWDALLVDIDGVLHVGEDVMPGAADALASLRRQEVPFRLVTNTTSRSRAGVVARLVGLGLDVSEDEVLTPAALAVAHCHEHGYDRVALHVAADLRADLGGLQDAASDVDAVILGDLGAGFTYERLNAIFRQLDAGAALIALQRNRVWQREDGLVLDAGPFVVALEYATAREATVIGKPSPAFFAAALARLGVPADRAAMVGDDVEADVGGALAAGLGGVLVRTGKFREETLAQSGVVPSVVLDSVADIPTLVG